MPITRAAGVVVGAFHQVPAQVLQLPLVGADLPASPDRFERCVRFGQDAGARCRVLILATDLPAATGRCVLLPADLPAGSSGTADVGGDDVNAGVPSSCAMVCRACTIGASIGDHAYRQ